MEPAGFGDVPALSQCQRLAARAALPRGAPSPGNPATVRPGSGPRLAFSRRSFQLHEFIFPKSKKNSNPVQLKERSRGNGISSEILPGRHIT